MKHLLLLLFIINCLCSQAQSTHIWVGPDGGSWLVPAHWNTNSVPASSDHVVIPFGGTGIMHVLGGPSPQCKSLTTQGKVKVSWSGTLSVEDLKIEGIPNAGFTDFIAGDAELVGDIEANSITVFYNQVMPNPKRPSTLQLKNGTVRLTPSPVNPVIRVYDGCTLNNFSDVLAASSIKIENGHIITHPDSKIWNGPSSKIILDEYPTIPTGVSISGISLSGELVNYGTIDIKKTGTPPVSNSHGLVIPSTGKLLNFNKLKIVSEGGLYSQGKWAI